MLEYLRGARIHHLGSGQSENQSMVKMEATCTSEDRNQRPVSHNFVFFKP